MKIGPLFLSLLLCGSAFSKKNIFNGERCDQKDDCVCKNNKDSQEKVVCKDYEICVAEADKKASCVNWSSDNTVCKNEKGCACGTATVSDNKSIFNLICPKDHACVKKKKGAHYCSKVAEQGKKCEDQDECFCPKVNLQNSWNSDLFCPKGKLCANEEGQTRCVDRVLTINEICESEHCVCRHSNLEKFPKMLKIPKGSFCLTMGGVDLKSFDNLIKHDTLCKNAKCACQGDEYINQATNKIDSIVCSLGEACIGNHELKPLCRNTNVQVGNTCNYSPGCLCLMDQKLTKEAPACFFNQHCRAVESIPGCYDNLIEPGKMCPWGRCYCYQGDPVKPSAHIGLVKNQMCLVENGILIAKDMDNLNKESQCKNADGCLCFFSKAIVKDSICPGMTECPAANHIEVQCKNNEFCVLDMQTPCMSFRIGHNVKCENEKGCICLLDSPEASNFAKCKLNEFCNTKGENPTCIEKPAENEIEEVKAKKISHNEQCLDDTCLCKSEDESVLISCNKNEYCGKVGEKTKCLVEKANGEACGDKNDCLCKKDNIMLGCPQNSTCFLENGSFKCAKNPLQAYQTCDHEEGCGCKVKALAETRFAAKLGENNNLLNPETKVRPEVLKLCKKGEFCVRGLFESECIVFLDDSKNFEKEVTNIGAVFASKIASKSQRKPEEEEMDKNLQVYVHEDKGKERLTVVACLKGQVAVKIPGEDVYCSNPKNRIVKISHNDFCYNFAEKEGCECYSKPDLSGSSQDKCKPGQRCVVDGKSASCKENTNVIFACPRRVNCWCGQLASRSKTNGVTDAQYCDMSGTMNTYEKTPKFAADKVKLFPARIAQQIEWRESLTKKDRILSEQISSKHSVKQTRNIKV